MNVTSKSLAETEKVAAQVVLNLIDSRVGQKNEKRAVVVGLYGDLGSGKTTFTQAVARRLGISETVTSPTFIIEKIYKLEGSHAFKTLIHIDAYRLEKSDELARLGWQEIINDPSNLIFLEWPERVSDILPADSKKIFFTFINETTREIKVQWL